MKIEIIARGHKNITARHKSTIEMTKDRDLGPKGDCIVAVCADKAFGDLSDGQKEELRSSCIRVTFFCNGRIWSVDGQGKKGLKMESKTEMVIRKSDFECGRTLMVGADKASCDIPHELVEFLRDPENEIRITIETIGKPGNSSSRQSSRT